MPKKMSKDTRETKTMRNIIQGTVRRKEIKTIDIKIENTAQQCQKKQDSYFILFKTEYAAMLLTSLVQTEKDQRFPKM